MQYVVKKLYNGKQPSANGKSQNTTCNFLQNIINPLKGVQKIEEICQEMPKGCCIFLKKCLVAFKNYNFVNI